MPSDNPLVMATSAAAAALSAATPSAATLISWTSDLRLYLSYLCIAYYSIITFTLLPLSVIPPLRKLLHHGKLLVRDSATSLHQSRLADRRKRALNAARSPLNSDLTETDGSDLDGAAAAATKPKVAVESDWFTTILSMRVPKSWFAHFYIVALEQTVFFASSASKMHTGHYLLGLSFYIVTPLSIALAVAEARDAKSYTTPGFILTSAFVGCNLAQLAHHYFLSVTPKPTPQRSPSVKRPSSRVRTISGTSGTPSPVGSPRVNRPTMGRAASLAVPGSAAGDAGSSTTPSSSPSPSPSPGLLHVPSSGKLSDSSSTGGGGPSASPRRKRSFSSAASSNAPPQPLVYKLPHRGLFKKVTCPHYLFEIGIYACLTLMCPSWVMLACLVWVVANLTVSAAQSHEKYRIFPGLY
ncbi:hypothetical protein BCR44DRAFT_1498451 [Catenaria anguillulae PL171]|uniref:3-oxo-5-alpha-steroid 4-dehydrogenase C-terminal domain-containing protein n=1 Tax=Catenaria anguillulae PL171 TaxID=765915 RepID=A0A1Y2HVG6_9FUNG|nr:hypothetical protein BCR44DRAFT_1498451 [Catenaria anguillulae PL171]